MLGTSYAEHPGGKGLNQAVAAARSGARVAFVAAVGADAAGERLRAVLADDGDRRRPACERVERADRARADRRRRARRELDRRGARRQRDGAARRSICPASAVVLCQLEVPVESVVAAFRAGHAAGARTDPQPGAGGRRSRPSCSPLCDVIVPNEHEVELLGGVDALLASRVRRGRRHTRRRRRRRPRRLDDVPRRRPSPSTPIDTTGAGDAFCGSLAARLAAGDAARRRRPLGRRRRRARHHRARRRPRPTPSRRRSSDLARRVTVDAVTVAQLDRGPTVERRRCARRASGRARRARGRGARPGCPEMIRRPPGATTRRRSSASAISAGARMLATTTSYVPSTSRERRGRHVDPIRRHRCARRCRA